MEINEQSMEYLEQLSRFRLSDQEKSATMQDLNKILAHCSVLEQIDTDGVLGISSPQESVNVLRMDVVKPSLPREELLKNAPVHRDGYFVVPKTVE